MLHNLCELRFWLFYAFHMMKIYIAIDEVDNYSMLLLDN